MNLCSRYVPRLPQRLGQNRAVLAGTNLRRRDLTQQHSDLGRAVILCLKDKPAVEKVIESRIADMRPDGVFRVQHQADERRFHLLLRRLQPLDLRVRKLQQPLPLRRIVLSDAGFDCRSGGYVAVSVAAQTVRDQKAHPFAHVRAGDAVFIFASSADRRVRLHLQHRSFPFRAFIPRRPHSIAG